MSQKTAFHPRTAPCGPSPASPGEILPAREFPRMYRLGRMTRRVCDQAARLLRAAGQYLRDARRKPRTDKPEGLTLRIIVRVEVVK